jgi:hypothetical protein
VFDLEPDGSGGGTVGYVVEWETLSDSVGVCSRRLLERRGVDRQLA